MGTQVGDVKKRIQESQSFPAENQKLIYSGKLSLSLSTTSEGERACVAELIFKGKILNDTATIGTLNIKEKDFLVVMVSKVSAV